MAPIDPTKPVSDDLAARLRDHISPDGLASITESVALAGYMGSKRDHARSCVYCTDLLAVYDTARRLVDARETRYTAGEEVRMISPAELLTVKADAKAALGDLPGVNGFGIGKGVLRVYIRDSSTRNLLPSEFEGVPIEVVEVREIVADSARSSR